MRRADIWTGASLIVAVFLILTAAMANSTRVDLARALYTYRSHIVFLVFYSVFAITIFIARKDIVQIIVEFLKGVFVPSGDRGSGPNITSFIVFLVLILILIYLLNPGIRRNLVERLNPQEQYPGNISRAQGEKMETGSNLSQGIAPLSPSYPDSRILSIISVIGIATTLLITVSMILVAKGVVDQLRSSESIEGQEISLKRKLSEQINRTISRLEVGGVEDFRKTIVRLYMDMCELFARHGVEMEKNMTAREFMDKLKRVFHDIPEKPLRDLTYVFEKAVYSDYPITPDDRYCALQALRTIKEYLGEYDAET